MDGLTPEARTLVNRASPFQFRSLNNSDRLGTDPAPARQVFWFRLARPLDGADQGLQRVILTYASDMMLLGTGLMPHGLRWFDGRARIASLDHALWIHGPVRMDDWLFYAQDSPWTGEGRGLNLGRIFDGAGRLVASVSQEGSMRLPR
jgi:acyl-CoA thioesterase-2